MERVGILTLSYKTYNFGAQLQAYALQRVIASLGYGCEQIRFAWSREQTRLDYDRASVDQEAFEAFARQIPHSRRIYTPEDLEEANESYDHFVCGSDQIWGVKKSMPLHVLPQMALSFVHGGKKKIAYGASFGSAAITEERKEVLCCFLDRLDHISVREPSAIPMVKKMTEKQVVSVLDPVMLLRPEEWRAVAAKDGGTYPQESYVLLYSIACDKELYDRASAFAREKKSRLIHLAYIGGMSVGPCGFIRLIEHADYVVTDSFHGSVLSVLFHKPFVTLGVDRIATAFSKNTRAKDMLDICGLGDRFFLRADERCFEVLDTPVDYASVDRKIAVAAASSVAYLKKALRKEAPDRKTVKASQILYDKVIGQKLCTGCTACTGCEAACVEMGQDRLGFYRPDFDFDRCMDCGQCLRVCPVYPKQQKKRKGQAVLSTLALRARDDEVVAQSSSGGACAAIADRFLADGGIVCGAVYDRQDPSSVKHICVDTREGLAALRKSKYVQSDLGPCFSEIRRYLGSGKKVLFVGTPCQAVGLKAYLQKNYEGLYIIDLICGGVTAPLLWKKYVEYYRGRFGTDAFDMRSKSEGFFREDGKLAFSIAHKRNGEEYLYEKEEDLFLSTRMSFYGESCYKCCFKGDRHGADLTIGDFVGFGKIAPEQNDDKGMNLVLVRSEKGQALLADCKEDILSYPAVHEEAAAWNEMIGTNMKKPLGTDLLRGIAPVSSIERICHEARQIRSFQEKEALYKNFIHEIKRNELLLKIDRYALLQCKIEYDPLVKGKVVIYGAGKLGRALIECLVDGPLCFLDQSDRLDNVYGCPVYQPGSAEFERLYDEHELTVLVTPVWDYHEIREELERAYPRADILSVDKVMEKIWV